MSSSELALSIRGVSKSYVIEHGRTDHSTLAQTLLHRLANPLRRRQRETFWALNDVSFDVRRGEIVGIIGRNGAGKSTLLKIISRISEPTAGAIDLYGRVGSLLEVGTGFHPELTGRENIFLNGQILGMRRAEVRRQFDAIVDFAGVERFLDTPVKRYSSGMYVRLAFAVAAHLDPDILIVDEVLAVGDADFQKKCMGKMQDVSRRQGRTVLFVSHNMGAVNDLCTRCVLLDGGAVAADGTPDQVTRSYLSSGSGGGGGGGGRAMIDLANGASDACFTRLQLSDDQGVAATTFDVRRPINVRMAFSLKRRIPGLQAGVEVFNYRGDRIFYHTNLYANPRVIVEEPGDHELAVQLPPQFLVPGDYSMTVALHVPNVENFDVREHALSFEIEDTGSARYEYGRNEIGCVLVDLPWKRLAGPKGASSLRASGLAVNVGER
ncbi:MAG TPA: ABC transporter ATP-binding protein [Tepidisphaeraceae bacterium]|nr:ABC transporter ATP-binding protein [Tepidisphaeraceae bacterium]